MKKIITAIQNPKLNNKLKELNKYEIVAPDIQYQEAVLEILQKENIDYLILSECLEGNLEINEFIEKIKQINSKTEILIILEKENNEKINKLKLKNINNIFYNNKTNITEIINTLENLNNKQNNIEDEIKAIKQLIIKNQTIKKENKLNIIKNNLKEKINKKKKINYYKKTKIICVCGTTGVGKSIISACLGNEAQKQNIKTLIIDFDILNTSIHTIFGKKIIPQKNRKNIKLENLNINNLKIKINKNLDLICGIKLLFNKEKINLNQLNNILEKLKSEYKLIIIDTSSECFFDYNKFLLEKSDNIIFLTQTNLLDIKKSINLLKIYLNEWQIPEEKINIILNKYDRTSIDERLLKNTFFNLNIIGKIKLKNKYNLIINKNISKIYLKTKSDREYKKILFNIFNKKIKNRRFLWMKKF